MDEKEGIVYFYNQDKNKPIRVRHIEQLLEGSRETSNNCLVWIGISYVCLTIEPKYIIVVPPQRVLYQLDYGALTNTEALRKLCHTPSCINPGCYEIFIKFPKKDLIQGETK